jgi:cyclopropane-fatty-acyl-phospholipid synthase
VDAKKLNPICIQGRTINAILAKNILPDSMIRIGIRQRLAETLRENKQPTAEAQRAALMRYVQDLKQMPVAIATDEANQQHYEVPTRFYQLVLGKHLKYSSGYWPDEKTTFDESEAAMLQLTCERAEFPIRARRSWSSMLRLRSGA